MSENDVPSGPLARLRAQLAGPRGYRRIESLLSQDDAEAAIAALAPNEVFALLLFACQGSDSKFQRSTTVG